MAAKVEKDKCAQIISQNLQLDENVVSRILVLLDNDNTIPFIARYRKEHSGGLDPAVLRHIDGQYQLLKEVQKKAESTKKKIGDQLTIEIREALDNAQSVEEVDEIFGPFKKGKQGTLAGRARQLGLDVAAERVLVHPQSVNLRDWVKKDTKGLSNIKEVSTGVQHVLAETISKDPSTSESLKALMEGCITLETSLSRSASKKTEAEVNKYKQYHAFKMPITRLRSHQILAINRAEQDKILTVKVAVSDNLKHRFLHDTKSRWIQPNAQGDIKRLLSTSIEDAYSRLLEPRVCRRARTQATKRAERESVDIFSQNLYRLLLTPPVKGVKVLSLDPGFTHGCKLAVVDPAGKVLEVGVIYPIGRKTKRQEAEDRVKEMVRRHRCETIAIGNGVGCREAETFISDLIKSKAFHPLDPRYCIVSEDGASVYSASNEAMLELPNLEISMRGAVSLGRRLQDPLLELVKIEPKHLGIGMYQHDIPEVLLRAALQGVLTDCVSFVGADLNAAGVSLLKCLSGLNEKRAQAIVEYREKNNGFVNRAQLLEVKGIGEKTYEQCVGFVRVRAAAAQTPAGDVICLDSDDEEEEAIGRKRKKRGENTSKKKARALKPNPLDMTPIHPEAYGAAERNITSTTLLVVLKVYGISGRSSS
ncbi:S1 RNA-binding domain-containing protein 1 isoform X2 [Nematostella vectensis]|uniref:S1 RNA-binding domain-containing protein 1 isoform X2 n=1 Tax=Nematostella vectensis TaxID=45351 RepID=UPI002076D782|nr:S1 RNA-binding domain-containing protein 1 isoform X2 [Nematostella vectensis]